jgi:hypothetical protein
MYLPDFVSDIMPLFIVIFSLFKVVGNSIMLLLTVKVCGDLEIKLPDANCVVILPDGMPKFNIALDDVPVLVTVA